MADTARKAIGIATAYAYAVSKGYTGTQDEFAELMAGQATVAQRTEDNVLRSEGYALGKQNGTDVESGSPYYHNNAKYHSEQSASSAQAAAQSVTDAAAEVGKAAAEVGKAAAEVDKAAAEVTKAQGYAEQAEQVAQTYGMHGAVISGNDYKLYVGAVQ